MAITPEYATGYSNVLGVTVQGASVVAPPTIRWEKNPILETEEAVILWADDPSKLVHFEASPDPGFTVIIKTWDGQGGRTSAKFSPGTVFVRASWAVSKPVNTVI